MGKAYKKATFGSKKVTNIMKRNEKIKLTNKRDKQIKKREDATLSATENHQKTVVGGNEQLIHRSEQLTKGWE